MSYNSPLTTNSAIPLNAQPPYVVFWGHHSARMTYEAPPDRTADLRLPEKCRTAASWSQHLAREQSTHSTAGHE